jgi:hypothetical protein
MNRFVVVLATFAGVSGAIANPVGLTLGNRDVLRVEPVIVTSEMPSFAEHLAAKELRRYLYVRTGKLLGIQTNRSKGDSIVVGVLSSALVLRALGEPEQAQIGQRLGLEGYCLKTVSNEGHRTVVVTGKTPVGTLHAAYKFVETLGIRFAPSGDIIPDGTIPLTLPSLDVCSNPTLAIRGFFPYHSGNAEGPEYWNRDDYMLFVGQQAKLGLNLIAMLLNHRADGSIDVHWTGWDEPYKIAKAPFGMAKAFKAEQFRSDHAYQHPGADAKRQLSDLNTQMLRDMYRFGRAVGVDACMGGMLSGGVDYWKKAFAYLSQEGFAPTYIWQHTYENWLYTDPAQGLLNSSVQGFRDFLRARDEVKSPVQAVVSGWTIGPRKDPLLYDRELPKEVVVAPLVKDIGRAPVDPAYGDMIGRPKWVAPWLEDDFNMIAPQLWVRRLIDNVVSGRAFGCTGLIGIHWRTKAIEPQMIALSRLGWDGALNADAFFLDYCQASYGPNAGPEIARLLSQLDGKLPRVTDWSKDNWPGGIHPDREYWATHKGDFLFVDQLEAVRTHVRGPESLARFDYLLAQMRYLRAMGKLRSALGTPDETSVAREAYTALLESTSNSGELGDLIFLNRQIPRGKPVDYSGRPHLLVRTPRPSLSATEDLKLDVVVLESGSPREVRLDWRPLGAANWRRCIATKGYGNSFSLLVPHSDLRGQDFEYRLRALTSDNKSLLFPASAARRAQTVVVMPLNTNQE